MFDDRIGTIKALLFCFLTFILLWVLNLALDFAVSLIDRTHLATPYANAIAGSFNWICRIILIRVCLGDVFRVMVKAYMQTLGQGNEGGSDGIEEDGAHDD